MAVSAIRTVRVNDETWSRVAAIAQAQGVSLGAVVKAAILEHLERMER